MPETLPPPHPETHEHESIGETFGLSGRLVLSDQAYLNPNKKVPKSNAREVELIDGRNYSPFEQASLQDRKKYWERDESSTTSFSDQYTRWENTMHKQLNSEDNREKITSLSPLFSHINTPLQEGGELVSKEAISGIYNTYFEKPETGVKQFVKDVLAANKKNETADHHEFYSTLPNIEWFSSIFGTEAKEMVKEL